jgi:antitoxin HicB
MRQVVITPAEEGGYWASVPSLPGCFGQGDTWEETLKNIQEAIDLYVESLAEHGEQVPEDNLDRVLVTVEAA